MKLRLAFLLAQVINAGGQTPAPKCIFEMASTLGR